jgi:hypothetical protein
VRRDTADEDRQREPHQPCHQQDHTQPVHGRVDLGERHGHADHTAHVGALKRHGHVEHVGAHAGAVASRGAVSLCVRLLDLGAMTVILHAPDLRQAEARITQHRAVVLDESDACRRRCPEPVGELISDLVAGHTRQKLDQVSTDARLGEQLRLHAPHEPGAQTALHVDAADDANTHHQRQGYGK